MLFTYEGILAKFFLCVCVCFYLKSVFNPIQVILIVGVSGGCRIDEFTNLTLDNIEDHGSAIVINIVDTLRATRSFSIMNRPNSSVDYLTIFRKYASLRPNHTETTRFFIHYLNGKCSTQVVGKNTLGKIPKKIAEFLGLPEYENFNFYSFKNTAQSLQLEFYNDGALQSLSRKKPKAGPSISEMLSHEEDNGKREAGSNVVQHLKLEPELILEDSVIQYLKQENSKN